jgi:hypothetical protein
MAAMLMTRLLMVFWFLVVTAVLQIRTSLIWGRAPL